MKTFIKNLLRKSINVFLPCTLFLTGCAASPQPETGTFFAMDTVMDFTIYGDAALLSETQALIADLEAAVSVTNPDSNIYAINQNGTGTLSGNAAALMQNALALCRRTNGILDLSIYPIVRAWGFTTEQYQVPAEETLQALLPLVDYTKINYDTASGTVTLPAGMEIDLGSVAKGFAGQQAADYLRENGVSSALLNLGGNIQTVGCKPDGSPWQIAIKDPQHDHSPMLVLSVTDKAVVTSGGYERYFEQAGKHYCHIMSSATGHPAETGLTSVTIVGEDGLLCDGLSTSLFLMGLEDAAAFWAESNDFEAVFVTEAGTVYLTEGLKTAFALTEDYADTPVHVLKR